LYQPLFALLTHLKSALEILFIGLTRATPREIFFKLVLQTKYAIVPRQPVLPTAHRIHTNNVAEIIFTGTILAEIRAVLCKLANTDAQAEPA